MDRFSEMAGDILVLLDQKPKFNRKVSSAVRGEIAVLRYLEHQSGMPSCAEITRALDMSSARIAAILDSLEKKGLACRSADLRDKRRTLVSLTSEGRRHCELKQNEFRAQIRDMLAGLGEQDAAELIRIIKRIHTECRLPEPPSES